MLEMLIVIGAFVVAIIAILLLIWVVVILGVIAFFAYVISDVTGISFPMLLLLGVIGLGLYYLLNSL